MRRQDIRIAFAKLFAFALIGLVAPSFAKEQQDPSAAELVEQFKSTSVFWKQIEVAKKLMMLRDASVLRELIPLLSNEDRHLRGNAAFVFARLGDARGFEAISVILKDRSDRPQGQGVPGGRWTLLAQIRADRYYAAHLLGDLKDARAVPILIPLLRDPEINIIVPWALGQIGDKSAIQPLTEIMNDKNADLRLRAEAIRALEKLTHKVVLPKL